MHMLKMMFRCDGGNTPEIGTGHVARCSRLAEAMIGGGDVAVSFLMQDNPFARDLAGTVKWKVELFERPEGCRRILEDKKPDILVVDRLDSDLAFMEMARSLCGVLVSLDDLGPGAEMADILINGIVGDGKTSYAGPEYVVIPPGVGASRKEIRPECRKIFVSFGGYDHLNLTLKTARALERLDPKTGIILVVGKVYPFRSELEAFIKTAKRPFSLHQAPADFALMLTGADLAITNGGLTLFEAMAAGIPTLVLAQYEHQAVTAKRFQKRGGAEFIGMGDMASSEDILSRTSGLMSDHNLRSLMSHKAQGLVDGEGLSRVADLIRVVKPLDWDSGFFGFKIAKATSYRMSERMASFIDRWCRERSVRCLYYLCDCDHAGSVEVAERHGYHFTDIRVRFELDMEGFLPRGTWAEAIKGCVESDLERIKGIARSSYVQSRYYFDGNFDKARLEEFYSGWLENTFRSKDGKVFVAHLHGKIVGYISGEISNKGRLGRIILVGVEGAHAGSGVGGQLVDAMLDYMHGRGVYSVEVVTQGRNIAAQRLYQKSGFKIVSAHIWYHKWFH
ncbi:MAG: GNAT family N-acetyltransferase [Candidatus Micrarchaeota archaeon]